MTISDANRISCHFKSGSRRQIHTFAFGIRSTRFNNSKRGLKHRQIRSTAIPQKFAAESSFDRIPGHAFGILVAPSLVQKQKWIKSHLQRVIVTQRWKEVPLHSTHKMASAGDHQDKNVKQS